MHEITLTNRFGVSWTWKTSKERSKESSVVGKVVKPGQNLLNPSYSSDKHKGGDNSTGREYAWSGTRANKIDGHGNILEHVFVFVILLWLCFLLKSEV